MPGVYHNAKRAAKAAATGAKKAVQATADFGAASVRAVGATASSAAHYVGSTSVGKGTGYVLKYASHGAANALEAGVPLVGGLVANRLMRFDDTQRLLRHSPIEQDKKLQEYNKSYDLSKYKTLCKDAQKHVHTSAASLLNQRANEPLDITRDEALHRAFEASTARAVNIRSKALNIVNQRIAEKIPKTKLSDIQQRTKQIVQGIEAGENPSAPAGVQVFHEPQEVIVALQELHKKAQEELEAEQRRALAGIEELFAPAPQRESQSEHAFTFKTHLALLLTTPTTKVNQLSSAEVDHIVAPHKAYFIKHIEDSYKKAKEALQAGFEDKTKQKDKDGKDLPDEYGVLTRAERLKESSEADLLVRIREYEVRKAQGATLPNQGLRAGVGGAPITDPACLKKMSLRHIKALEVSGRLWGTRQIESSKTTSGTTLQINEKTGEISFSVPGLAFPYHVVSPERLQEDFEDMVERALAKKDTLEIEWKIEARTDELRSKMIIAAYKASIAKGIDPKHITMTVSGGNDKQSFTKRPIDEILEKSQPPIIFSKTDADFIASKRKEQLESVRKTHEVKSRAFADRYKNSLNLRERGIEAEDEIELDSPAESERTIPGPGNRGGA